MADGASSQSFANSAEWAAAVKAADPLGFYYKGTTEEMDAAREAGRQAFDATAENPFAPVSMLEEQQKRSKSILADPAKMKELRRNLGADENGEGPMDPLKLKDFQSRLLEQDPLRKLIDEMLASMGVDEAALEAAKAREDAQRATQPPGVGARTATDASGEAEGGADGKTYKWEQTSNGGESEVLVRFTLRAPATKKDVKVVFKVQGLKVTVAGETLFDGKTFGKIYPEECTWSLVEQTESSAYSDRRELQLQVLLSLVADDKWQELCAK